MFCGGHADTTSSAKVAANRWQALDGKGLTNPAPVAKQNMGSYCMVVHCGMAGKPFIPHAEASQSMRR
jgi:hypothetical protein